MSDLPQRLYRTKLTLLAVVFVVVGLALLALPQLMQLTGVLKLLPLADIGSALFTTGLIGVALQYLDERDSEERASRRLRRVLAEEAPAIRDAVVDGFAFAPDALLNVTSPQVLEQVIRNCLSLQLQDERLAAEGHALLLKQSLTPEQRRIDGRLEVTLRAHEQPDLLWVRIRREYRFVSDQAMLRFACVGTRDEYDSLLRDPETTEVHRVSTADGLDVSDPDVFTITTVELDGESQRVKRLSRKDAQVYTCKLPPTGQLALRHLAYEYEVLVPRKKHCLYFDEGRPLQALSIEVHADESLAEPRLLDFLTTGAAVRRSRRTLPGSGTELSIATDGWVLPRSGVVLVWH
jgi:hypothetical protein